MLFGPGLLGHAIIACCCGPRAQAGVPPGVSVPPGAAPAVLPSGDGDALRLRRGTFPLDPFDMAELTQIAKRISKDTGRTCGDFFPLLLQPGPTQDLALAGRQTLLKKVGNLKEAEASFAATTICVNLEEEERRAAARPRPKPPVLPQRRFAMFREAPGTLLNQRVSDRDFASRAEALADLPEGCKLRVGPFTFGSGLQCNVIEVRARVVS